MSKLLSGYRIIESSMLLNGATTAMMLVDLGAEVIKVESPFLGDYLRAEHAHPIHMHMQVNKGKRSLALDLRKTEGRDAMYRLIDTADAFVTNAVGTRNDKLGIGDGQVRARKPNIVYCQNTGFGAEGLFGEMPTHGQMMDAMAGNTPREMGEDGLVRPKIGGPGPRGGEGTATGAIYAAFHIAAGLAHRERTGEGCYIDVSSADAVLASGWISASAQLNHLPRLAKPERPPTSDEMNATARYQYYQTRDRKFVLFCPEEKKFWTAWCELVGRPDLIPQVRGVALRREIQKIFHTKDREEWLELALKHRLPLGPAHTDAHEVAADRHMQSRQILKPTMVPGRGEHTYVGQPAIVDHQPYDIPFPAPDLGQHTNEVLAELGYSAAEIEQLAKSFVTTAEKFEDDHIAGVSFSDGWARLETAMFGNLLHLGYVVGDLDAAMARLGAAQGMRHFQVKESVNPQSAIRRNAKAYAGPMMLEIMETAPDVPSLYTDYVDPDPARLSLQHIAYILDTEDDYAAAEAWMKARDIAVAMSSRVPGLLRASYYDTRAVLGHYTEYVHLLPGGKDYYADVPRNPR